MMKIFNITKALAPYLIVFVVLVMFSASAMAFDVLNEACSGGAGDSPMCQDSGTEVYGEQGVLTRIAQLIIQIVGAASIIMIIVGGFKYVVSNGDQGKVASAKSTVIYALIGLVVAVLSQAIILLVLRRV
jgi:hypothetical protein